MMMDTHMNDIVEESNARSKCQSSSTTTTELMVYVDAVVQNDAKQNGFSAIDYVLGIINIVSDMMVAVFTLLKYCMQIARLYRDSTLQHQIELTWTRLILEGVNVRTHVHTTHCEYILIVSSNTQ